MNLLKAIARANKLRPNAIDDSIKADWVFEIEMEVAELMGVPYIPNSYPKDMELLMPEPKDNIYYLYLMAMIDNAIEDTQLYVNDMVIFNEAKSDAFKWWRRHHMKPCGQYIRAYPWQRRLGGVHGDVTSVNGMTGDVELEAGDIPYNSKVVGTECDDVQGALSEAIVTGRLKAEITTSENYLEHKDYYDNLNCFILVEDET